MEFLIRESRTLTLYHTVYTTLTNGTVKMTQEKLFQRDPEKFLQASGLLSWKRFHAYYQFYKKELLSNFSPFISKIYSTPSLKPLSVRLIIYFWIKTGSCLNIDHCYFGLCFIKECDPAKITPNFRKC